MVVEFYFPETAAPTPSLAVLLELNEFFRHVQPPFKGWDPSKVLGKLSKSGCDRGFWDCWLNFPLAMPDGSAHYFSMLAPKAGDAEDYLRPQRNPSSDSRAFVHTCALRRKSDAVLEFESAEGGLAGWLALLNIERPESHSVSEFERDWLKTATYARWQHQGCFYGYTAHSSAMYSDPNTEFPTWQHFRVLYFDQTCMLLFVNAAINACSLELVRVSKGLDNSVSQAERMSQFETEFTHLVNLYYYPSISGQQQGMELYQLQRQALQIEQQFEELRQEIQATQATLAGRNNLRLTKLGIRLAWYALWATIADTLQAYELIKGQHGTPIAMMTVLILVLGLAELCVQVTQVRLQKPSNLRI